MNAAHASPSLETVVAGAAPTLLSIADAAAELGVAPARRRVYERWFEQRSVARRPEPHAPMLADPLARLVAGRPDLRERAGLLLYAKTQSHNTPAGDRWLDRLRAESGLSHWDAATLSMAHCASGLLALDLVRRTREQRPVVVLAGEKCMHRATAVQSASLLGEAPVAALIEAGGSGWRIADSRVVHAPRFHANPDRMTDEDRRAFERGFGDLLARFLEEACAAFAFTGRAEGDLVVPYNLNLPLLRRLSDAHGWEERMHVPDLPRLGHLFCADVFQTLAHTLPQTRASRILVFAAGMGATFATALIVRPGT